MDHDGEIATERFSTWLRRTRRALRSGEPVALPCGDCTACCTSSYFVHIDADETATLAAVPGELKFAAPGQPPGSVVLGYDRRGHCPLFDGRGCAIYERRPRTCRTYDCRVFPATGLTVGGERPAIARGAARFRFDLSSSRDRADLAAVRAAARFLTEHTAAFPAGFVPGNPTQQAVVAVKVYEVFRDAAREPESGTTAAATGSATTPEAVAATGSAMTPEAVAATVSAMTPKAVAATVSATVAAFARFEAGKTPA